MIDTVYLMAEVWGEFHNLFPRGNMSKRKKVIRFKKSGKGKVFRPCHVCGAIVNFVPWAEETIIRARKIWHWANEDGSHHVHFAEDEQVKHLRDILRE